MTLSLEITLFALVIAGCIFDIVETARKPKKDKRQGTGIGDPNLVTNVVLPQYRRMEQLRQRTVDDLNDQVFCFKEDDLKRTRALLRDWIVAWNDIVQDHEDRCDALDIVVGDSEEPDSVQPGMAVNIRAVQVNSSDKIITTGKIDTGRIGYNPETMTFYPKGKNGTVRNNVPDDDIEGDDTENGDWKRNIAGEAHQSPIMRTYGIVDTHNPNVVLQTGDGVPLIFYTRAAVLAALRTKRNRVGSSLNPALAGRELSVRTGEPVGGYLFEPEMEGGG